MKRIIALILAGLFILFSSLPASAGTCSTACKKGPKEYREWSRWSCIYDAGTRTNMSGFNDRSEEDYIKSSCYLRIEGHFTNIETVQGRYKNYNECFENTCLPKLLDICGEEDRCADPKKWFK